MVLLLLLLLQVVDTGFCALENGLIGTVCCDTMLDDSAHNTAISLLIFHTQSISWMMIVEPLVDKCSSRCYCYWTWWLMLLCLRCYYQAMYGCVNLC